MKHLFYILSLVASSAYSLDVNIAENKAMDKLMRFGVVRHSEISVDNNCSVYPELFDEKYIDAIKAFRQINYNVQPLTIKEFRDSFFKFFDKNGLRDFYDKLSIYSIEVLDPNHVLSVIGDDNLELISEDGMHILYACDEGAMRSLFHDKKYNDIRIGSLTDNPDSDGCYFTPSMRIQEIQEGYISNVIKAAGEAYFDIAYPQFYPLGYLAHQHNKANVYALALDLSPMIFEFRYLLEKEKLSKDDVVVLAERLPVLLDNSINDGLYYKFANLALSLASQTDKKLADIISDTAENIYKNVMIDDTAMNIRDDFSEDSNADASRYGVDENGVIHFNAEKNKAIIIDWLNRMGFDGESIVKHAPEIAKDEYANFINIVKSFAD